MIILFGSVLVPVVIRCALVLAVIVVTNAIVLHNIEAGADVRTVLIQGPRTRVRRIPLTAAATIVALIPLVLSSGVIAASPATIVIIRVRRSLFPCPDQHRTSSV